jgi:hypothetical protein
MQNRISSVEIINFSNFYRCKHCCELWATLATFCRATKYFWHGNILSRDIFGTVAFCRATFLMRQHFVAQHFVP